MRTRLEDIAAEFERLSMDERLRFEMRNHSGIEVLLAFRRVDARPWSMWFTDKEHESKQTCGRSHLHQVALSFGLEPSQVVTELSQCLILQAAYASEFVRQVAQIVGQSELEEGLQRTRAFMDQLTQMVQETAHEAEPQTTSPKATSGQPHESSLAEERSPARRPQLRIIKPDAP